MKKSALLLALVAVTFAASPAFACKTYQVTGPVTDMTADTITVQKSSEKWEMAKGSAAMPDNVKVGSKVMIQYCMTADTVMSKDKATKASSSGAKPSAASPAMHP